MKSDFYMLFLLVHSVTCLFHSEPLTGGGGGGPRASFVFSGGSL